MTDVQWQPARWVYPEEHDALPNNAIRAKLIELERRIVTLENCQRRCQELENELCRAAGCNG